MISYTVSKLIEALKQFPEDLPIVVSGYESGFENLLEPKKEKLEHNPNAKYWDGEFQIAESSNKTNIIEAVVLERVLRTLNL